MLGTHSSHFATTFGIVLRRLRKAADMSQEALALEAELQRNYVSLMELGRYQPTLATIFKLAEALKMPPSLLVAQVEVALNDSRKGAKS
jgi:transcriptional regulator with XRE-family HTH domain